MDKLIFDIGATNTKFALMSTDGVILAREKFLTNYESIDTYFQALVDIVDRYRNLGDEIAISTNGRMTADGNTYRAYIIQFLQGVNLKEEMERRTGLPVTIINDGFSAALGEWWKGAGQGYNNLLVIVLGSGMGAGLIINGELYQGSKRNAAMVFGMLSSYKKEQFEIGGMTTTFALLLYQLSAMKQLPLEEMTGQRFFDFVAAGDPVATAMLEAYCENIATILYNSAQLLDLDRVIITGGLSTRELIINQINQKLTQIPSKLMQGSVSELLKMVAADQDDFLIQATQGTLALDANLYGALYHLLNKEKGVH